MFLISGGSFRNGNAFLWSLASEKSAPTSMTLDLATLDLAALKLAALALAALCLAALNLAA